MKVLCRSSYSIIYYYWIYLLDSVWALTADRMICSSTGQVLEKPARAQYVTQATFVPDSTSQGK